MNKLYKYALVLVKDGKFLIVRKKETKLFLMPGGRPEGDESIEECLVREIREELDCNVVMESVKYFGDFEDLAANEPNTIIHSTLYSGKIEGDPKASSEIEEIKWFGKEDDKEILSAIIKNKIYPAILERGLLE